MTLRKALEAAEHRADDLERRVMSDPISRRRTFGNTKSFSKLPIQVIPGKLNEEPSAATEEIFSGDELPKKEDMAREVNEEEIKKAMDYITKTKKAKSHLRSLS